MNELPSNISIQISSNVFKHNWNRSKSKTNVPLEQSLFVYEPFMTEIQKVRFLRFVFNNFTLLCNQTVFSILDLCSSSHIRQSRKLERQWHSLDSISNASKRYFRPGQNLLTNIKLSEAIFLNQWLCGFWI